jgi:hypothetical protein
LVKNEEAILLLQKAVAPEAPRSEATAYAHHLLAVMMKEAGLDSSQIEKNMEIALNMGFDLTPETLAVLGEHNIAVIKSIHRTEWKRYQESALKAQQQHGGIMSGPAVSSHSNSIFAPDGRDVNNADKSDSFTADALTMLEQGAASYDGSYIPSGDDFESEFRASSNLNQQSRTKIHGR